MKDKSILRFIQSAKAEGRKLFALLIDPDKWSLSHFSELFSTQLSPYYDFILLGGSEITNGNLDDCLSQIRHNTRLPIVLFPGNPDQISTKADGLLLLSLLSGRNPEYLIGHHVNAAKKIKNSGLEIIPTAYIHIGDHTDSAVSRVSKTSPIPFSEINKIQSTAIAGEQLGFEVLYLEAGSGANTSINSALIESVGKEIGLPLIVGGGMKNYQNVKQAWASGADVVIVGNALEQNPKDFFAN